MTKLILLLKVKIFYFILYKIKIMLILIMNSFWFYLTVKINDLIVFTFLKTIRTLLVKRNLIEI